MLAKWQDQIKEKVGAENLKISENKSNIKDVEPKVIIVIGDDTLILNTFRELSQKEIPLLGIASSRSFLAQCDSTNFERCIILIEKNKYSIFPFGSR